MLLAVSILTEYGCHLVETFQFDVAVEFLKAFSLCGNTLVRELGQTLEAADAAPAEGSSAVVALATWQRVSAEVAAAVQSKAVDMLGSPLLITA